MTLYEAFEYIKDENAPNEEPGMDNLWVSCGPFEISVYGWRHDLPWDWFIDGVYVTEFKLEWDNLDIPVRDWEARYPGLVDAWYEAHRQAFPKEGVWQRVWTSLKSYASRPSWRNLVHGGNHQDN